MATGDMSGVENVKEMCEEMTICGEEGRRRRDDQRR
jgi:hypothetical protein